MYLLYSCCSHPPFVDKAIYTSYRGLPSSSIFHKSEILPNNKESGKLTEAYQYQNTVRQHERGEQTQELHQNLGSGQRHSLPRVAKRPKSMPRETVTCQELVGQAKSNYRLILTLQKIIPTKL